LAAALTVSRSRHQRPGGSSLAHLPGACTTIRRPLSYPHWIAPFRADAAFASRPRRFNILTTVLVCHLPPWAVGIPLRFNSCASAGREMMPAALSSRMIWTKARARASAARLLANAPAFRLPFGAPGEGPPCIRQRPFGIAGDRHWLPRRVRAPQRGLWCIGKLLCMGLFFVLRCNPSPGPNAPTMAWPPEWTCTCSTVTLC
jgi:hypothetical protein